MVEPLRRASYRAAFPFNRTTQTIETMKHTLPLFALLLSLAACAQPPISYTARVTGVHDGDTVRVTDAHGAKRRIRLAYIDAPELDQAHGIASRDALRQLVEQQTVRLTIHDTDRYQRQVATITLGGQDINRAQIESGNAWHYRSIARKRQNPTDYAQYSQAEARAKQERIGLWRDKNPLAPWAYRQQQRAAMMQENNGAVR